MSYLWGLDLGGTKVEGVVMESLDPSKVLARRRIPTEKEEGYHHIIGQIKKLLDLLAEEVGAKPNRIGIGTPGTNDPITNLHKNSNTTVLNGQPFKKDLEAALGIPVRMANDANCFALAEAKMGAVQQIKPDAAVVFGVIMGTGVGGGLVVNGQVLNGRQGITGEWGHNFLDESGGSCYCGRSGCVETVISGPSLERFYEGLTGENKKLKAISEAAQANDPAARQTIDRLVHFFAKGMGSIINMIDPDVIVLGGGVGNIDLLYTEGVARVQDFVFNHRMDTLFARPALGDSAGVFGAASL